MTNQQLSTNTFATAKWIVSPNKADGTHTTIAGALAAASSGDTIFIRPGTYFEAFINLVGGVNLTAYTCDAYTPNVKIVGQLVASFSGKCSISGICIQTNGATAINMTGANGTNIDFINCNILATNATGITNAVTATGAVNFYSCTATSSAGFALFACSNSAILQTFYSVFGSSDSTSSTSSGSSIIQLYNGTHNHVLTSSGTGAVGLDSMFISSGSTPLVIGNTGQSNFYNCSISGTSSTAITIAAGCKVTLYNCMIISSNTSAISGAGTLAYTPISFGGTSSNVTVSTQNANGFGPRILLNGGAQLMSGTGDPSGAITAPQGTLYLRVDGSSTTTRAYINTDSATGWTSVTTAT